MRLRAIRLPMLAALVGAALSGTPSLARADFALNIYDNGTLVQPLQFQQQVTLPTGTGYMYSATTNNYRLSFGVAVSNSPGANDIGNIQITNFSVTKLSSASDVLTIAFSASDFTVPNSAPLFLSSSASLVGLSTVGGTTGSGTVTYNSYVDTNNNLFGNTSGTNTQSETFSTSSGNPTTSGDLGTQVARFNPSLPVKYSLTSVTTISLDGIGNTVSMQGVTAVTAPAPAGLVLALTGLPCLGIAWLRRRKQQA